RNSRAPSCRARCRAARTLLLPGFSLSQLSRPDQRGAPGRPPLPGSLLLLDSLLSSSKMCPASAPRRRAIRALDPLPGFLPPRDEDRPCSFLSAAQRPDIQRPARRWLAVFFGIGYPDDPLVPALCAVLGAGY